MVVVVEVDVEVVEVEGVVVVGVEMDIVVGVEAVVSFKPPPFKEDVKLLLKTSLA